MISLNNYEENAARVSYQIFAGSDPYQGRKPLIAAILMGVFPKSELVATEVPYESLGLPGVAAIGAQYGSNELGASITLRHESVKGSSGFPHNYDPVLSVWDKFGKVYVAAVFAKLVKIRHHHGEPIAKWLQRDARNLETVTQCVEQQLSLEKLGLSDDALTSWSVSSGVLGNDPVHFQNDFGECVTIVRRILDNKVIGVARTAMRWGELENTRDAPYRLEGPGLPAAGVWVGELTIRRDVSQTYVDTIRELNSSDRRTGCPPNSMLLLVVKRPRHTGSPFEFELDISAYGPDKDGERKTLGGLCCSSRALDDIPLTIADFARRTYKTLRKKEQKQSEPTT